MKCKVCHKYFLLDAHKMSQKTNVLHFPIPHVQGHEYQSIRNLCLRTKWVSPKAF